MAKKVATNLDMLLNELLNARIQNLAANPVSPVEGQIYYNTATKSFQFYNGTGWVALGYLNQITATGAVSVNNNLISNVSTPIADSDAATKGYVDTMAQGLDAKNSCRVSTTANITLSGTQTIDGIAVIAGDRVLVRLQNTTSQNGIYVVAAGAWTRALDMDVWDEFPGAFVFVEQGTAFADSGWVCTVDRGGTIGTTAVTWVQFSQAGSFTIANLVGAATNKASVYSGQVGSEYRFRQISSPNNQGAVTVSQLTNEVSIVASTKIEALHDLASTGVLVQTGATTWAVRTIEGGNDVTVTNGTGVSGNPSIAVNPTTLHDTRNFAKYKKVTFAFVSGGTNIALTHNLALPAGTFEDCQVTIYETASKQEVVAERSATAATTNIFYIKMWGGTTGAGFYTAVIVG